MKPNSPILWGLGLAVSGVVAAIIGWGRVRDVEVPRAGRWAETPALCSHDVPAPVVTEAVNWWRRKGHPIAISCERPTITLDADPTVDVRASVEDVSVTHGLTAVHQQGTRIVTAEIRVRPGVDALIVAHEIGHALGWQHPRACPSGHILHPSRPGWDGRGVEGP